MGPRSVRVPVILTRFELILRLVVSFRTARGRVWGSDEVNVEGWKALKRLPGHSSGASALVTLNYSNANPNCQMLRTLPGHQRIVTWHPLVLIRWSSFGVDTPSVCPHDYILLLLLMTSFAQLLSRGLTNIMDS
jgi:hypothetical protein